MRGDNDWNAVCTAGVVCSALALLESPADRAEILAAMEISNPFFIDGFTDDGDFAVFATAYDALVCF